MKFDNINIRLGFFIVILVLLTPIGIILPHIFNAGDAWGEWSLEDLGTIIGYIPQGAKQIANLWHPLFPDYNFLFNNSGNILFDSLFYVLSGIIGASFCFAASFVFLKNIIKEN